jgi:hypothetical protein
MANLEQNATQATEDRPRSAQLLAEATHLKGEAVNHLEQIKTFKREIEANGGLTPEDREFIMDWLETEVATRVELADDRERELKAIAAGEVASSAVVVDTHHNVMTSSEVAAAQSGDLSAKK